MFLCGFSSKMTSVFTSFRHDRKYFSSQKYDVFFYIIHVKGFKDTVVNWECIIQVEVHLKLQRQYLYEKTNIITDRKRG